jgi:prolyl oligopeptidase
MILLSPRIGLAAVILSLAPPLCAQSAPPTSRTDNFHETFHGMDLVDPFHWLEDSQSPETRRWIDAQNGYAHGLLDPQPIRKEIARRVAEMEEHDHIGAPELRNGFYFFYRRGATQDLWSFYRRSATGSSDELLLDPHTFGPAGTSISVLGISDSGGAIAFGVRQGGQDETDLRIFDVAARRPLPDHFAPALYRGLSFTHDGKGFFYALENRETGQRLLYHALGTDAAGDREVFGQGLGADVWVDPYVSEDGRYLLISVQQGWAKGDLYLESLDGRDTIHPLIKGHEGKFTPTFSGESLFVETDWKAPKGRILRIDLRDPSEEKWREVVPPSPDAIDSYSVIGGKLYVTYLHNVVSHIRIFSLEGKPLGEVSLPGAGSAGISGRSDQSEGILFYSSYTTPYSLFRLDAATGKETLWYRDDVPFDSSRYTTEQVWYPSKDGTRIPMTLIHRKGMAPDRNTPVILYGYGGFDISLTPEFESSIGWWIEHGGLYAVANLRGGGEFGEAWHHAGMLDKKQNVFDDFTSAAEWLIGNRYTNPEKLAIWGGSNGGLLVAAALTERPGLFRAVICWHPDLDMVRYYKYTKDNNPPALLEYGNGADPAQFKYLYAYSPYEHVAPGTGYPAVLLESGDADTRVPPEQARKMTARLQAATASGRPVLLLYDAGQGHAGGQTTEQQIEEETNELTFVSWQLGLSLKTASATRP